MHLHLSSHYFLLCCKWWTLSCPWEPWKSESQNKIHLIASVYLSALYMVYLECSSFFCCNEWQDLFPYGISIYCIKRRTFSLQYKLLLQIYLIVCIHTPNYLDFIFQLNTNLKSHLPPFCYECLLWQQQQATGCFAERHYVTLQIFQTNMDKSRFDLIRKLGNCIL